jgi:hypothetical protein
MPAIASRKSGLSAVKAGFGLAYGSTMVVDKRLQPPGYLLEMTDLIFKKYYIISQRSRLLTVNPPGSTLLTHISSFRVHFSTLGNVLAGGLPLATFSVRGSFQLYICNPYPDEPASMTIPKWRPARY